MKIDTKRIKNKLVQIRSLIMGNPFASALVFLTVSWWFFGVIVYWLEKDLEGHNINNFQDGIWWGIVTFLTVGYGDRFPVGLPGRVAAGLLMICGVLGIAVITAKISSFFLERALLERRGFVDSSLLKGHYIICGWKKEMSSFLMQILDVNTAIHAEKIVLINNSPDADIEGILNIPRLEKIKIIKGDFFTEHVIRRAAPEKAAKILILADATPDSAGNIPTMTEADARTVMTAMTLSNIAKGTPIVAEILDSAMDQYLKIANVHEIVYSRDYSRMILGMASAGTGITNIFHDLINPHSQYHLRTKDVPIDLVGKTYSDVYQYFKTKPGTSCIGILENSGNVFDAKELAIRKAQQTPNIAQLVANLQSVKSMRFNRPIFNPEQGYVIKDGTMAIVIEVNENTNSSDVHV